MERTCAETGAVFTVSEQDLAFYDKVSPVFGGKKYPIPPPTLSPLARLQRRMAFANQIHVYFRPSSLSGEPIFSVFPEDAPFPVYENAHWWSDSWDGTDYSAEFDAGSSFFVQFHALTNRAPHAALNAFNNENCDYCNNLSRCKNCYFVFNTSDAEDCFYCENAWASKDCIDCTQTTKSELCYDCTMCTRCYSLQSSRDCENCRESAFLFNCRSCEHCFCCVNLRHKSYCIFNKQCSKEEYERFMANIDLRSCAVREEWRSKAKEFWMQHPRPHAVSRMVENSSGNYVYESKEVSDSFFVRTLESCRYCFNLDEHVKDCYDYTSFGINAELVYETARSGDNLFNVRFCLQCTVGCSDLLYCAFCSNCKHCFGCAGLYSKEYCIFNTQYSKEEYERLVPKIIESMMERGEWGEFFPMQHSPIPYKHSLAERYFPLSDEEIRSQGLHEYTRDAPSHSAVPAAELPDGCPESNEPIVARCQSTQRAFRITAAEIKLLRRMGAPLPRMAYDVRMTERARTLGGVELFDRVCAKTGKQLQSTIPSESPWIIWDRDEYEKEFSG